MLKFVLAMQLSKAVKMQTMKTTKAIFSTTFSIPLKHIQMELLDILEENQNNKNREFLEQRIREELTDVHCQKFVNEKLELLGNAAGNEDAEEFEQASDELKYGILLMMFGSKFKNL